MRTVFLSIVSLSFGIIPLLLLLFVLRKQIKKRFGAGWVRLIWIAVLLRLLIPCSFTGVSLLSPNLFAANPMSAAVGAEAGAFWQNVPLLDWLAIVWALVAVLLLLYHVLDYGLFQRHLLRWSREPQEPSLLEIAEDVRKFWNLPGSLKILICSEMKTPASVGVFRPVIVLPTEQFDDADLTLILHHEAAHLRRGDIIVKWCSMIIRCLYWFHPLVHRLCSQLADDLEAACDAAVMKKLGQEQEIQKYYSYLILDIAAGKNGRFYPFTTCLQDTRDSLRSRIDSIFDTKPKPSGLPALALCGFCLLLSSGLVQLQYQETDLPVPLPEAEQTVPAENSDNQSVVTIDLYQLEQQLEEQGA